MFFSSFFFILHFNRSRWYRSISVRLTFNEYELTVDTGFLCGAESIAICCHFFNASKIHRSSSSCLEISHKYQLTSAAFMYTIYLILTEKTRPNSIKLPRSFATVISLKTINKRRRQGKLLNSNIKLAHLDSWLDSARFFASSCRLFRRGQYGVCPRACVCVIKYLQKTNGICFVWLASSVSKHLRSHVQFQWEIILAILLLRRRHSAGRACSKANLSQTE